MWYLIMITAMRFLGSFCLAASLCSLWFATPTRAENILFYGNSFTLGQGSTDSVPNLVRDIATAAGQTTPTVFNAAVGGQSFTYHLANNLGPISSGLPVGQFWDYAVLQNFSTAPTHLGNVTQHRSDSVSLYQEIANHSSAVTPVLFETWARGPGHSYYTGANPPFPGGPSQMQAEVRSGYQLAVQDIDAAVGVGIARIAEVGDRWEDAAWDNLHAGDIYHAQNRGTLLTSLEIYSTIYQKPTSGIDLSGVLSGLGLTTSEGQFLTAIVDGVDPPELTNPVTMKFDFGIGDSVPNINTVAPNTQNVANAIDTTGAFTGISLVVDLENSTGWHETGENDSGTNTPSAPASDYFSSEFTEDNLYGHVGDWGGTAGDRDLIIYDIAGLDQDQTYDFTFFASRLGVTDNRETQYDLAGDNLGTGFLNPAGNTNNVAQVLDIQPDENGKITLTIQKGPSNVNSNGFFYLGAMDITSSGVMSVDFDDDGDIDGNDFLEWQRGFGSEYDDTDLVNWEQQYGSPSFQEAAAQVIPEPASLALSILGFSVLLFRNASGSLTQ